MATEKNMRPKKPGYNTEDGTRPTPIVETSEEIARMDHIAHLATALVNGATIERWRRIPKEHWVVVRKSEFPSLMCDVLNGNVPVDLVRVREPMVTINGHEFPEPWRKEPAMGQVYFYPDTTTCAARKQIWVSNSSDRIRLHHGLMHASEEAADKHLGALLSFTSKAMHSEHDEEGEF